MNNLKIFRAAIVASKIKSTTLPKKITVTLMQNLSYMDLFSNLLLSKPALPTEENQILTLCTVLGANLPYVQDKDAFVTLCSLSRRLLSSVKNEPRAMLQFCLGDGRNIKVIVGAAVSSDDVVGYNALNLLEKLMHLQVSCVKALFRAFGTIILVIKIEKSLFKCKCKRCI